MKRNMISFAVHAAILGLSTISASAMAADVAEVEKAEVQTNATSSEVKKEEAAEKITVTGSRIRRDSFSVATPLAIMDKESLEDTGLGSLSEILLEELPQVSEGSSNSNSQSSVQNTGLSTIDLRELGTTRTLTLIDGRRMVSNSYSGNYVSLSTIPSGMVEKVEIITGGASSSYGSDAIAGVVNIITQQDKEGFSAKVRHGESVEGGGRELSLDADFGTEFADGRGYMFISASFDKQYGLDYWDRDRAQQEDAWTYDDDEMCNAMYTETGYQCIRDITKADWTSKSDSIPGGVFDEVSSSRPDAGWWYDGSYEQGPRDDWWEERYGVHSNKWVMLKVPDERSSIAAKLNFDISDDITAYAQVQFSQNHSVNDKSPESEDECDSIVVRDMDTGAFGKDCIGRIPADNPYIPQEMIDDGISSRGIKWDRSFEEVGRIINENTRDTLRSWAGLQGTMFDGEWDWDLSVSYGKFTQDQNRQNEIYISRVRNALEAEELPDGTIQCKSADARAEGCVPINLFGVGSITPAAADYIRADATISATIEQTTIMGYATGDLFELPAGVVSSAFGFEYRKDEQSVSTNVPYGDVSFNYVPDFKGDINVAEAFAEASIPLLRDVVGAKSLTLDVSARIGDYSLGADGLVQSYKAGFIWEPLEGYNLRANWARAQRAPGITELLSPQRGDYDTFYDICEDVTATSTDAGHDNCRKEPTIAAWIDANPGEKFEDDNSGYSPNVGNDELFEETGDTYTVGFSMAPEFIDGFRFAIDYYDISIKDAISQFDNADIIEFCYDSSLEWGSSNPFCNDIIRNEEGQIETILQRVYNVDEISTEGYDIAAEYKFSAGDIGDFKLKLNWTHVNDWSQTVTSPDGPKTDSWNGYLSTDIFNDKGSLALTWKPTSDLRIRWSTKVKGAVKASKSRYESWQDDIAKNDERCAEADPVAAGCIAQPEELMFWDLPAVVRHNLSVSYKLDIGEDGSLRVFGGVNNIGDEDGPFILGGRGNYDSQYGGGMGRFYYLGAEVRY